MLLLDACAGRSDVGGKAETLARVRAAGLATADGVVLLPDEPVDAAALAAALARLGGERFCARSSSTVEDAAGGSAAGLFRSRGRRGGGRGRARRRRGAAQRRHAGGGGVPGGAWPWARAA